MIVKLDQLARVVVPAQFRHELGLEPQSQLEVTLEGGRVILRPLDAICTFCGDPADDTVMDKGVCDRCAKLVRGL